MAVTTSSELCARCRKMTKAAGELNKQLRRQRRLQQGPEPDPTERDMDSLQAQTMPGLTTKRDNAPS